ncbi:hypothetical protein TWF173_004823 [Orbilia oligospora]|nr:hypothetical protein TWF173_004823 [Orbilia oligospora]
MAGAQDQNQPLALESIFNHIVIPAQLPGKEDHDVNAISATFSTSYQRPRANSEISLTTDTIESFLSSTNPYRATVKSASMLVLHVTKQNAALVVRRENRAWGDSIIFEAFETSPTSHKALGAESALEWGFPTNAVSIPYSTFNANGFQEEFVSFLKQISKESIKRFAASCNQQNIFQNMGKP